MSVAIATLLLVQVAAETPAPAAAPAPTTAAPTAAADDPRRELCRMVTATGTRTGRRRVCVSGQEAEWIRRGYAAQEGADRMRAATPN